MKKNQLKEWRNALVAQLLLQFSNVSRKKDRKLRKMLEANVEKTIRFYKSLLPKKEWKRLQLQSVVLLNAKVAPGELTEYTTVDH